MKGIFIAGADTEVGKTWVSCALIQTLRRFQLRVGAYKPVASGGVANERSDPEMLWEATGRVQTKSHVCPQMFAAPFAPPLAASLEGRVVDQELLVSGAHAWEGQCDVLVVEGAGGLLSPLTFETTNADLASRLGWPIVVVVSNRLGAVNQSLMVLEVARARRLTVAALVLNEALPASVDSKINENARMIRKLLLAANESMPEIVEFRFGQAAFIPDTNALPNWLAFIVQAGMVESDSTRGH
ncbi:MAG: dethiobiotin synthase [Pirellulaceae bacterium]|nr:dethiobiotin synthase [Pirellulaceae bacterium]